MIALKFLITLYVLVCILLYLFQERLIFFPEKLPENFPFSFGQPAEELTIKTADGFNLNGLLFKTMKPRGLIFYLHGNAGSLASWGDVAKTYTDLSYDVFILDYRSYGKSEGKISGQNQLFQDVQKAYNELKKSYKESEITVLGYSLGTGFATKIAADNNPKLLILQAPFYSMTDMVRRRFPFVPTFLLKYKFRTDKYIQSCEMPIVMFHGDQDEVIYHGSSLKLEKRLKKGDQLITLKGQGHNGMTLNPEYLIEIKRLLTANFQSMNG